MKRASRALIVGIVASGALLAAGCRTRLLDVSVDGGASDLASSDLGGVCDRHRLLPRAVTEMRLLDPGQLDPGQLAHGSVIRVLLGVPLRPCEAFGDVVVRVTPGNATDFAVVQVNVWQSAVDCGAPVTAYRVAYLGADLPLSSPNLVIGDGAPGGTARIDTTVSPRPMANCSTAVPMNGTCQLDCQCEKADPKSRCILDNPRQGRCGIPCEEDAECPEGAFFHCDTDFDWTCSATPQKDCGTSCPFGQACRGDSCRPIEAPVGGSCGCDGDCGAGRMCSLSGVCFAPCTTDEECPANRACGTATSGGGEGLCGAR